MTEPLNSGTGSTAQKPPVVSAPGGRQWYRNVTESGLATEVPGQATPTGPLAIIGRQYDIRYQESTPSIDPTAARHLADLQRGSANRTPSAINFNLPPHAWSLPIDSTLFNSRTTDATRAVEHGTRRGLMWCYSGNQLGDKAYDYNEAGNSAYGAPEGSSPGASLDMNWGFQFLWNPETIGNNLTRNANFTPNASDRTAGLYGLFTAMEGISFTVQIDRTNDFACIKGSEGMSDAEIAEKFYKHRYPSVGNRATETAAQQVSDLKNRGTMADIEYLFRMINGDGAGSTKWTNALGRQTADIGFLSPTIVALSFSPRGMKENKNKIDGLSYVGYVNSLNISHTRFTEEMVPIHSEVTVDFVAYARTTLTAKE